MKAIAATSVMVVGLSGCDAATPIDVHAIRVTTVEAAVTWPEAPALARFEAGAAIAGLADDDGTPVAATASGLIAMDGVAVEPVALVADAGGSLATGAVLAFARRDAGLLVSADAGLFHTFAGVLLRSPASDALAGATAMSVVGEGAGEVVWAALPDGLHRLDATTHERVVIPDEAGAPGALAANAEVALVAYGDRLYELTLEDLAVREVPAAIGVITRALAAGSRLFAGGDDGLVMRDGGDGYVKFDGLGPVLALSADDNGVAYARVAAGVLRLDPGGPSGFAPTPAGDYVGLALDREGHVWLGQGDALVRLATGRFVSFAEDIVPVLAANCAPCHASGERAPRRDFTDYDVVVALSEAIFTRVSTGLMPPPPNPRLAAEDYDLIVRWYAGERAP